MDVILLIAAVFGLCFLVDKAFTKLFRSKNDVIRCCNLTECADNQFSCQNQANADCYAIVYQLIISPVCPK